VFVCLRVDLCVNKCVEIPVPDTDCQGLENQFLRGSGWQVASREQNMLKERKKFVIKSRTEKVARVSKMLMQITNSDISFKYL